MDRLPEELLADILRLLPPRPLAICRSVAKDLRAVVDSRGLLAALAHRMPLGLRGILINYVGQNRPYFFSRRAAAPPHVDGDLLHFLDRIRWYNLQVLHHCNGLVLFQQDWGEQLFVCNPATRRWAKLPQRPDADAGGYGGYTAHLVFDPTVSLHYEVISFSMAPRIPKIPAQPGIERPSWCQRYANYQPEEMKNLPHSLRVKHDEEVKVKGSVQWPPSFYVEQVFSSRTGRWEERTYVREDNVAVTLLDVWSDPWGHDSEALRYFAPRCNAVCWRGAFYLHCRGGFIMRLSLLEQKYKVIKTPNLDNLFAPPRLGIEYLDQELLDRDQKPYMHFGKSEDGIYYTALCWHQLQVWVLREVSESRPMPEWELKHKVDLRPSVLQHYMREKVRDEEIETSWSLDNGKEVSDDPVDCGWDSSDDSTISVEGEDGVDIGDIDAISMEEVYCRMSKRMDLLGYHPSKEIAFLGDCFEGFAYYLCNSKLKYLGTFYPVRGSHRLVAATHESFIYTPCMDDLLYELNDDDDEDE